MTIKEVCEMLYGGQIQTMMPKLHSTNLEGMELIRPTEAINKNRKSVNIIPKQTRKNVKTQLD